MTPASKTTLAAVLGLAVGGLGLYAVAAWQPGWLGLGMDMAGQQADAGKAGDKKEKDREVLYWVAPMDDSYRRDEPGKSPMGMDLVPVYADEAASKPGAVNIDPAVVSQLGVETAAAERRTLSRTLRTVGSVTYDERKVSHIHTRVEGWVEKLYVDAEGDRVEVDDPILEIYSPELVTAQQEYLIARRRQKRLGSSGTPMSDMVQQARERLLFYGVSPREIERLERTGELQRTVLLRAPHAGVVTELGVREGMRVTPDRNLYTVADLSTVWVQADVYAYQAEWVAAGDPVTLTLPFYPGREWTGKVDYVYPYLDPKTRTVHARLVFKNPDGTLKPNMFATAVIEADPRKDVVAVPRQAVIRTGQRTVVVTALGKGHFRPVAVETGVESGDWVEITKGLKAGTDVVTSGQFLLDAESDFDASMERMDADTEKKGQGGSMEGMDMDGKGSSGSGSMEGMDGPKQDGSSGSMEGADPADGQKGGDAGGSGSMEGMDMPDQSRAPAGPPVGAAAPAATPRDPAAIAAGTAAPTTATARPYPGRRRERSAATSGAEPVSGDCHGPLRALAMTAGEEAAGPAAVDRRREPKPRAQRSGPLERGCVVKAESVPGDCSVPPLSLPGARAGAQLGGGLGAGLAMTAGGEAAGPAAVGRRRERSAATSGAEPVSGDCHGPLRALAMTAGGEAAGAAAVDRRREPKPRAQRSGPLERGCVVKAESVLGDCHGPLRALAMTAGEEAAGPGYLGRRRERSVATSGAEPVSADCHGPLRALAMTALEGAFPGDSHAESRA